MAERDNTLYLPDLFWPFVGSREEVRRRTGKNFDSPLVPEYERQIDERYGDVIRLQWNDEKGRPGAGIRRAFSRAGRAGVLPHFGIQIKSFEEIEAETLEAERQEAARREAEEKRRAERERQRERREEQSQKDKELCALMSNPAVDRFITLSGILDGTASRIRTFRDFIQGKGFETVKELIDFCKAEIARLLREQELHALHKSLLKSDEALRYFQKEGWLPPDVPVMKLDGSQLGRCLDILEGIYLDDPANEDRKLLDLINEIGAEASTT
jgi:hypothetical protein